MKVPFDWLVHLDRQLVSPMELLQVSGFKPHELTQQFMLSAALAGGQTQAFRHRVPWYDQSNRLYRIFEFLETGSRAQGVASGGRIPGKININTIWDQDVFNALCDALQPTTSPNPNNFNTGDVQGILSNLLNLRTYNSLPQANAGNMLTPSGNDSPFLGFGVGYTKAAAGSQYPTKDLGIENTLFRSFDGGMGGARRLFQLADPTTATSPQSHPYINDQLLNKIYNNLTTRSNVFAVWVTVGFFEVIDDTTRPVKLGAEIGRNENRNVRHRMFAIVDRSNLATTATSPIYVKGEIQNAAGGPGGGPIVPTQQTPLVTATIQVPDGTASVVDQTKGVMTGSYEGTTWTIQQNTQLTIDTADWTSAMNLPQYRENITVLSVDTTVTPPTFTAKFSKFHPGPVTISPTNVTLGNPGPQTRYNPRQDPGVVRYLSIIQ
jgi:hypothetical protein